MKEQSPHVSQILKEIDNLILQGLLYIEPAKPVVIVSPKLHLAVMDNERKAARWPWRWLIRHGWVRRDVRYRRLMKAVSIYLNLMRGNLMGRQIAMGTDYNEAVRRYGLHTSALHFIVADIAKDSKPLLLGSYANDRIALVNAPSASSKSSESSESFEKN